MRKPATPGPDPDARRDGINRCTHPRCASMMAIQSVWRARIGGSDATGRLRATRSTSMTPGWSSTRGTATTRLLPCWSAVMNAS